MIRLIFLILPLMLSQLSYGSYCSAFVAAGTIHKSRALEMINPFDGREFVEGDFLAKDIVPESSSSLDFFKTFDASRAEHMDILISRLEESPVPAGFLSRFHYLMGYAQYHVSAGSLPRSKIYDIYAGILNRNTEESGPQNQATSIIILRYVIGRFGEESPQSSKAEAHNPDLGLVFTNPNFRLSKQSASLLLNMGLGKMTSIELIKVWWEALRLQALSPQAFETLIHQEVLDALTRLQQASGELELIQATEPQGIIGIRERYLLEEMFKRAQELSNTITRLNSSIDALKRFMEESSEALSIVSSDQQLLLLLFPVSPSGIKDGRTKLH